MRPLRLGFAFHEVCRETFGFPDFYGMNMNAWIDCLTYLDEGDGMSRFHLTEGEVLRVEIGQSESFRSRLPEIFNAIVECTSIGNERYIESGKSPKLELVFC